MATPRIGLLGGSFDPVHKAHIALALAAQHALALDEVQLLPAAQPWQKGQLGASDAQRLAMLKLAIQNHPQLSINTTELERGGVTYTYDTVSQLPTNATYFWILGSDQLQGFPTWSRWQDILQHVELAVAKRPHSSLQAPEALQQQLTTLGKTLHIITMPPLDVSSTQIRDDMKQHSPHRLQARLDPHVLHYIQAQQLYNNHHEN